MKEQKIQSLDDFVEGSTYRTARMEANPEGLLMLDKNLVIISWNKNAEIITGVAADEVLGQELFKEKFRNLFSRKRLFKEALNEKKSISFVEHNTNSGTSINVSLFSVETGLIVTFRNITKDVQKEQELKAFKNLKRHVLNSTPDKIWAIDNQYRLLLGNDAYFEIMKTSTGKDKTPGENILGDALKNDTANERRVWWKNNYDSAKEGFSHTASLSIEEDSQKKIYHVSFNPIRSEKDDGKERILGVACFARDITERSHHMQFIEDQNKRLREIAWLQSHKIRAPLTNIIGLSELSLNSESFEEKETYLELIAQSAAELDGIISEISGKTRTEQKE